MHIQYVSNFWKFATGSHKKSFLLKYNKFFGCGVLLMFRLSEHIRSKNCTYVNVNVYTYITIKSASQSLKLLNSIIKKRLNRADLSCCVAFFIVYFSLA